MKRKIKEFIVVSSGIRRRSKINSLLKYLSLRVIFIANTLLLWDPRDIVQIAYHLRQKSPLHFATSHNTLQQSQLHT